MMKTWRSDALTRILLVDDDELVVATMTELLEQSGFAVTGVVEAMLRRFLSSCSTARVGVPGSPRPSPVISQLPVLELGSPHRIPNVGAPEQDAGSIHHGVQGAARIRICILAVPEITSSIEQAQVDHRTTGYRGSDTGARVAGNEPVAGNPKGSRDPQNIGQKKAPLEIHDIGR
jgi:hypothetical protein